MQPKDPRQHVFRDLIEEHRKDYSLSYQPADARSSLAILSLFFPEIPIDRSVVSKAMEKELEIWLKRFPVPVKVTAFNARKRTISLSPVASECHLMGYVRLMDDAIVRRWNIMGDDEIPRETYSAEHLEIAYAKIPARVREEVREMERLESRERAKSICLTIGLMLLFPLFLQAILVWGYDLVAPLTVVSFLIGLYKGAGIMGFRKPSRFERRKAERLGQREHYFFHCEKNPVTFARLENENFKREVSRENKEAKRLLRELPVRKEEVTFSWIPVSPVVAPEELLNCRDTARGLTYIRLLFSRRSIVTRQDCRHPFVLVRIGKRDGDVAHSKALRAGS